MSAAIPALIIVNCIPLIGVMFFGWSLFEVVALYWVENLIIGAFNIPKMILCSPDEDVLRAEMERHAEAGGADGANAFVSAAAQHAQKFFLVPFFTVHYFGFCAGHGVFVFMLLGAGAGRSIGSPFAALPELLGRVFAAGGGWFIAGLIISHAISFFVNYIGKAEWRRRTLGQMMSAPYGRIVVLHIAILAGAFAIQLLGAPVLLLVLLIAGKTVLDVTMHLRSHRKAQAI